MWKAEEIFFVKMPLHEDRSGDYDTLELEKQIHTLNEEKRQKQEPLNEIKRLKEENRRLNEQNSVNGSD